MPPHRALVASDFPSRESWYSHHLEEGVWPEDTKQWHENTSQGKTMWWRLPKQPDSGFCSLRETFHFLSTHSYFRPSNPDDTGLFSFPVDVTECNMSECKLFCLFPSVMCSRPSLAISSRYFWSSLVRLGLYRWKNTIETDNMRADALLSIALWPRFKLSAVSNTSHSIVTAASEGNHYFLDACVSALSY